MKAKPIAMIAAGALSAVLAQTAIAQAKEQFVGLPSYRVGAYAAGGTGIYGGWIDYMTLVNERDGGINGVKLSWEECETEYNNARGVECYERMKKGGETDKHIRHFRTQSSEHLASKARSTTAPASPSSRTPPAPAAPCSKPSTPPRPS